MATTPDRRRAHVTMPVALIDEIDALVGRRGRSRFLEDAAVDKLKILKRVPAFDRLMATPTETVPEWETRASAAEWPRELRGEWVDREPADESGPLSRLSRVEAFKRVVGSLNDAATPGWESPEAIAQRVRDLRNNPEKLAAEGENHQP